MTIHDEVSAANVLRLEAKVERLREDRERWIQAFERERAEVERLREAEGQLRAALMRIKHKGNGTWGAEGTSWR